MGFIAEEYEVEINGDIIFLLLKSMESMETPACSDQSQELKGLFLSLIDKSNVNRARSEANEWPLFDWLSVLLH